MTSKEKSIELLEWAIKYGASKDVAKLFAMKIVEEVINSSPLFLEYWEQVKHELNKSE